MYWLVYSGKDEVVRWIMFFGQGKDEVGEGWGRLGKGWEKSGNKSSDLKNLWYLNFKWGAARGRGICLGGNGSRPEDIFVELSKVFCSSSSKILIQI